MTRRVSSFCPREQAFALKSEQKHFDIGRDRFSPGFVHHRFVNWEHIRAEKRHYSFTTTGSGEKENDVSEYLQVPVIRSYETQTCLKP